jgi:hypothetical protein
MRKILARAFNLECIFTVPYIIQVSVPHIYVVDIIILNDSHNLSFLIFLAQILLMEALI